MQRSEFGQQAVPCACGDTGTKPGQLTWSQALAAFPECVAVAPRHPILKGPATKPGGSEVSNAQSSSRETVRNRDLKKLGPWQLEQTRDSCGWQGIKAGFHFTFASRSTWLLNISAQKINAGVGAASVKGEPLPIPVPGRLQDIEGPGATNR